MSIQALVSHAGEGVTLTAVNDQKGFDPQVVCLPLSVAWCGVSCLACTRAAQRP